MKSKEEFLAYDNQLTENDVELENKTKNAPKMKFNLKWLYLLILIPVAIIISIVSTISQNNLAYAFVPAIFIPIIFVVLIVVAIICLIPYFQRCKVVRYFEGKYKDKLVNFLLEYKTFLFEKEKYVTENDFRKSKMFSSFNRYEGEDFVTIVTSTQIGEMVIRFSDLNVENVTKDSKGNSSTTTVFNGVFGYCQLEKHFEFKLGVNSGFWKYEKVSLESIDFNKKFKLYSNDQITSRLIFTPDRMQKLMDKNLSKRLSIHLFDNRIYFAFHREELFKTVLSNSTNQINVDDFYHDIQALNEMIEELKKILNDIY